MVSTCDYSIRQKKENIFFCFVVSTEVSVVIDVDGVMVLFLVSLIGRCMCSTDSAPSSNGSGGFFFWAVII